MKVLQVIMSVIVIAAYFWFNWKIFDRKDDG